MKISGGPTEKGVVIGNTYDKYNSGNPILRRIMQGFEAKLLELVEEANPSAIHEVGCGEGYWVLRWLEQGLTARGSDFSSTVINLAKDNASERNLPEEALRALQNISQRHVILSVPREPIWSMMNMFRGKYWSEFGDTPGHIQRWSQREFIQMVSQYFFIEQVCAPFPWTMLLCSSDRTPS